MQLLSATSCRKLNKFSLKRSICWIQDVSCLGCIQFNGAPRSAPSGRVVTEINRTRLVLFGMHSRIFGPYLTAVNRILISAMGETRHVDQRKKGLQTAPITHSA
jgi:hypothetical protein